MKIIVIKCSCCRNLLQVDLVKETSETIPGKLISFNEIVTLVCNEVGLTVEELKQKNRKHNFVEARYMVFWLARKFTKSTLTEMAGFFGGRDHTTAVHGIAAINDMLDTDQVVRDHVSALCRQLDELRTGIPAEEAFQ